MAYTETEMRQCTGRMMEQAPNPIFTALQLHLPGISPAL